MVNNSNIVNAMVKYHFSDGIHTLPCKVNKQTHEVFDISGKTQLVKELVEDDDFSFDSDEEATLFEVYEDLDYAEVEVDGKLYPFQILEMIDYLNRQKAITEKQLSDLSSGIFLQNFDYIVYGKRLASKSENTVEFVENTIVSHNKQELEVVASGMEAMGLSVETGYFDPDDESSVDVPKQLIGFHYVVLKKKV